MIRFTLSLLVFCLVFTFSFAEKTWAQGTIAVVDMQRLLGESEPAQSILEEFSAVRAKFQDEITTLERDLYENEQALAQENASLSSEEFSRKRDEFEDKRLDTRRLVQQRKRALDEAYNKALGSLHGKVVEIISEISSDRNYEIVLFKQSAVILDKDLEITEAVMARLNNAGFEIGLELE